MAERRIPHNDRYLPPQPRSAKGEHRLRTALSRASGIEIVPAQDQTVTEAELAELRSAVSSQWAMKEAGGPGFDPKLLKQLSLKLVNVETHAISVIPDPVDESIAS